VDPRLSTTQRSTGSAAETGSEAEQRPGPVNSVLLEVEEGGGIGNELLVRAPEDASDQMFMLSGQREAMGRCYPANAEP
jgi:hypothetical protein